MQGRAAAQLRRPQAELKPSWVWPSCSPTGRRHGGSWSELGASGEHLLEDLTNQQLCIKLFNFVFNFQLFQFVNTSTVQLVQHVCLAKYCIKLERQDLNLEMLNTWQHMKSWQVDKLKKIQSWTVEANTTYISIFQLTFFVTKN